MNNQERIAELKKELETHNTSKEISQEEKEKREIKELEKKIRAKKYAKIKQTGRNIKIIGKNIGIIGKRVGTGLNKVLQDSDKPKTPAKRSKTFDEVMRDLPQ